MMKKIVANGIYAERLYNELKKRNFREDLCRVVANELRSDISAKRMLGYLREYPAAPMNEIIDEMLAIQSDREAWIKKKQSEHAQQSINEMMMFGLTDDEEE